mgnify:CR=1 FL=1
MTVTNGSTGAGATPRAAARGQERLHRLALPAAPLLGLLLAGVAVRGTALMELGEYPFSKRYGWIQDQYGVSWQVIHTTG